MPKQFIPRQFILSAVALLVLSACASGPDYKAPELKSPSAWRQVSDSTPAGELDQWWLRFNDPVLTQLVNTALANNNDLKIALSRVEEARAQSRSAKADFLPTVMGNAGASRNKNSAYAEPAMPTLTTSDFKLNIDLSYEIDLWGKLRRADEAASARLLASQANRDSVRQTLIAEVTRAYIDLRALDAQLDIAKQNLQALTEEYKLQKRRFDGGVTSELEANQAQVELSSAQVAIPELEQRIALQENALSIVLGQLPGTIPRGKPLLELGQVPNIPAGLPSDLLQRRPDLRAAEQALVAANADIGYVKAAYYPSLSLTGLFGVSSGDLSNLFKSGANTWNFGAGLRAPLVTGGKAKAAETIAETRKNEALASYQQAVLNAFKEVEDALVTQNSSREILKGREAQETALQKTLTLSQKRYRSGLSSYQDVLSAQRGLYQTQLYLVDSQRTQANASVSLYKALGGGWKAESGQK